MATYSLTTATRAAESAHFVSPDRLAVPAIFSQFLSSAATLITAERDLAGYCGQDPAVDVWIRDAERAVHAVSVIVNALLAIAPQGAGDRHLQRIGGLFRFVMLSDDPAAVDAVRRHFSPGALRFCAAGDHGHYGAVNDLARAGWQQLTDLLALDDALSPSQAAAAPVVDDIPVCAAA